MARASSSLPPSSASPRHDTRTSSCAPHSPDSAGALEISLMNDTCRHFDSLIARAGQLSEAETARLEEHLAGCGSCRELARVLAPVDDDVAFAVTGASEPVADADGGAQIGR